jgi:hypothetical protein
VHSFDKFVKKIARNVDEIGNITRSFWHDRIQKLSLNKTKQLPIKVNCRITKKYTELKRKTILRENFSERMSMQVYYVRCNFNFLMGFLMNKARSRQIVQNVYRYIKDKLKFDITQKLLKCAFSDKIKFLGFEIQQISVETSKYCRNKKLEVYKRHQNTKFRKGVQDYAQFLKTVE